MTQNTPYTIIDHTGRMLATFENKGTMLDYIEALPPEGDRVLGVLRR